MHLYLLRLVPPPKKKENKKEKGQQPNNFGSYGKHSEE